MTLGPRSLLLGAALMAVFAVSGGAARAAPGDVLPDLVADPADSAVLATDSSDGTARLLLRFAGYIHNAGSGPLDIRGSRPSSSSPMTVVQRIANNGGWRSVASPAQLTYETGDGHNHWHLMHAARYSLWNSARTAEAAPGMKVGFCLEDTEHVDGFGPRNAVYSTADPAQRFCQQGNAGATSVFEGISPGWRDVYNNRLAFQWVDVSDVQPGSYWLRSDVDPDGVVSESAEVNAAAWSSSATTIPGYVARTLDGDIGAGQAARVTLGVDRFGDAGPAAYRIVSAPAHGSLDAPAGSWRTSPSLTYTPAPGFQGVDSFTYAARDSSSGFPRSPAVATVTIRAGSAQAAPTIQISGAPESVVAGTSVQLGATVSNDAPGVTWSVDGAPGGSATSGTITPEGLYTAPASPPAAGAVTIAARSAAGGRDERVVRIVAAPEPRPAPVPDPASAPGLPLTGASPSPGHGSGVHGLGQSAPSHGRLTKPQAVRIGRRLILTVVAARPGAVRLTAYAGRRRLGACATRTPGRRPFTCRVRLGRDVGPAARIRVVASLRVGGRVVAVTTRPAARVPAGHAH